MDSCILEDSIQGLQFVLKVFSTQPLASFDHPISGLSDHDAVVSIVFFFIFTDLY